MQKVDSVWKWRWRHDENVIYLLLVHFVEIAVFFISKERVLLTDRRIVSP